MIDIHTHPVMIKELVENDPDLQRNINHVFGFHFPPQSLRNFTLELDAAGVSQALLLPVDVTSAYGCKIVSNEQIARLVDTDTHFLGFASVDPNRPEAPRELKQAIQNLGLRGLKLDPSLQRFYPNDPATAFPVYEACQSLEIPVLIHCGMSWAPQGLAKYAQPLLMEETVQAFPGVNFILAHFGWPWVNEAQMLAIKYHNVYLDTAILYSGTPGNAMQRVIGQQVGLEVVERSLANKILFGSNYPRVDIRRSVRGLQALDLTPRTKNAILDGNARKILKLEA
jgi:predicted TIM-barrel fold metal-dependent hydrolase